MQLGAIAQRLPVDGAGELNDPDPFDDFMIPASLGNTYFDMPTQRTGCSFELIEA